MNTRMFGLTTSLVKLLSVTVSLQKLQATLSSFMLLQTHGGTGNFVKSTMIRNKHNMSNTPKVLNCHLHSQLQQQYTGLIRDHCSGITTAIAAASTIFASTFFHKYHGL